MACANVAALLLARGTVRGPELALRMALGAGRGRIIRQLLAESVVLAMAGAALSLLVAWLSLRAFGLLAPLPGQASLPPLALDLTLVLLTTLLAVVTGVACGVIPAFRCSRVALSSGVGGGHKMTGSPGQFRLRSALVVAQVAASFVLLVGAALLTTSFVKLSSRDLNYDPNHLVTFDFRISPLEFIRPGRTPGEEQFAIAPMASASLARVLERVRAVPGVAAAGGISHHPTNSFTLMRAPLTIDGSPTSLERTAPTYFVVTPGFFAAMKTRLVRGREFVESDTLASPWVAVVNEALARQLWPGQDPIGRRIAVGISADERPREIVGVVADIPTRRQQLVAEPVLYTSSTQQPPTARPPWLGLFGRMTFVVRSTSAPADLVPTIRRAVAEVEPERPLAGMSADVVERYMWSRHSYVFVIGIFAIVATLVASFGVFGVMSYAVAQRSREIAIRVALGASPRDVLSAVGRHALTIVAAGLVAGVAAALATTRLLSAQLWNVSPTDPATFAGIAVLLTAVAGAACQAPVRRAIRVDPLRVLRES
jgi:putative ABC transport system permease protein